MGRAVTGFVLLCGLWEGVWQSRARAQKTPEENAVQCTGIVRQINEDTIGVECEDSRLLTATLKSSTSYKGSKGKLAEENFDLGATVRIDASQSRDGLVATSIELLKPPASFADDSAKVKREEDDDSDRPRLRHGAPAAGNKSDDSDLDVKPAASDSDVDKITAKEQAPKGTPPQDGTVLVNPNLPALLRKAVEVNQDFISHLPNFVCKQFTTRYERETRSSGWQAKDVITANVVYANGKEDYQDIRVGNKKVAAKDIIDIKEGQTSNGEFGSALEFLLLHVNEGAFRAVGDEIVRGGAAKIFEFHVKQPSEWRIHLPGQDIFPAYSGRMWVDKSTGRVVRVERQADAIPESFPLDLVEQTIDYDAVLIGGTKVFLPTESQNLACQRGTPRCSKNVLEFRNYREFRGEATIQYEAK